MTAIQTSMDRFTTDPAAGRIARSSTSSRLM